jgi:hypothetical protein
MAHEPITKEHVLHHLRRAGGNGLRADVFVPETAYGQFGSDTPCVRGARPGDIRAVFSDLEEEGLIEVDWEDPIVARIAKEPKTPEQKVSEAKRAVEDARWALAQVRADQVQERAEKALDLFLSQAERWGLEKCGPEEIGRILIDAVTQAYRDGLSDAREYGLR